MKLKRKYDFLVDFMYVDRNPPRYRKVIKSPGILGTLFRDIKDDIDIEDLYELEYEIKIAKEYDLDPFLYEIPEIFTHLEFIYSEVVIPLSEEIRLLLIDNNLVSEGDIFNSTCEFSSLVWRGDDAFQLHKDLSLLFEEIKERYHLIVKEYQIINFKEEGKFL